MKQALEQLKHKFKIIKRIIIFSLIIFVLSFLFIKFGALFIVITNDWLMVSAMTFCLSGGMFLISILGLVSIWGNKLCLEHKINQENPDVAKGK